MSGLIDLCRLGLFWRIDAVLLQNTQFKILELFRAVVVALLLHALGPMEQHFLEVSLHGGPHVLVELVLGFSAESGVLISVFKH